ncbi:MAG: hypothetical protein RIS70_1541, partial [Planctomycetota bacterium]
MHLPGPVSSLMSAASTRVIKLGARRHLVGQAASCIDDSLCQVVGRMRLTKTILDGALFFSPQL